MILARILPLDKFGEPDENQAHHLVGSPDQTIRKHTPATAEELTFNRAQQMVSGAGWLNQKLRDQGNQRVDLMLSTVRRFDSLRECFLFRMGLGFADDADKPHRMKGTVIARCQEGSAFAEVRLDEALILVAAAVPVGLSLAITYGIKAAAPAPYRSGTAFVSISAPIGFLSPSKAEVIIPFDVSSADGWTLDVATDGGAFFYSVNTGAGRPPIASNLAAITSLIVAEGIDATLVSGVGIRIHSDGTGSTATAEFILKNASAVIVLDDSATGDDMPPDVSETITVGGVTITADLLA